MKKWILTFLMLLCAIPCISQSNFILEDGKDFYEIPFESVSNLILVKATFNNKPVKFILDTGASRTLLFNWKNIDTLDVKVKRNLKIQGYGLNEPVEVYYTDENIIEIGNVKNANAIAFVLADRVLDLQPQLGIFINGIIGSDFFKDNIIQIDYNRQVIRVYREITQLTDKLIKYEKFNLDFQADKPYVNLSVINDQDVITNRFLIDTGSSEAVWITENEKDFRHPIKKFEDYLGFGVNGDVYGYRTKLDCIEIGTFKFKRVAVSFPYLDQIDKKESIKESGSIGGEILRRFIVIFDYKNNNLYLRKTAGYNDGFYFNMSGIQVRVGKINLYTLYTSENMYKKASGSYNNSDRDNTQTKHFIQYNYIPELIVNYVRENSPADMAGIKMGDKIISLEGLKKSKLTVKAVTDIFYEKSNKIINIEVSRDGKKHKYKFRQLPLID